MRVTIMTQVFPPEFQATAVMVRELGRHLASQGWKVTVVAGFPHHPYGRVFGGYRKQLFKRERVDGFDVLRTWHVTTPNRSPLARSAIYSTQAAGNAIGALLGEAPDVILAWAPPLIAPTLGYFVAKRHDAKLVNVIYDIYPDIAVETGKVTNRAVIGAARVLERFQYWATDRTIVLSEGFRDTLIGKGVPAAAIDVVPVWLDPDEIRPMDRNNDWRREHGIPEEKLVVLYAGTIGIVSDAPFVAEAAARLQERDDILFLFVGDGEAKAPTQSRVRELGLSNVRFLPYQPRERLPEVQATSDISLVTLAPGRGRTSVPSKMVGYMAAGRPTVAATDLDSDTARQLISSGAGIVVAPSDALELADAIKLLADSPDRRERMGLAARQAFVDQYGIGRVLAMFQSSLERAIQTAR